MISQFQSVVNSYGMSIDDKVCPPVFSTSFVVNVILLVLLTRLFSFPFTLLILHFNHHAHFASAFIHSC